MASRSGRLTLGLVGVLVAVLLLGSVGAIAIARHHGGTGGVAAPNTSATRSSTVHPTAAVQHSAPTPTAAPSTSRPPTGAAVDTPASSSADSSAATSADSDPSSAPVGPSNNLTVQMSPAARTHARAQDVQQALQSYFDAINQHDYPSWTQSVTRTLASHQTSAQWLQAYATTMDSSIWMQSVRDDPLQVQIRFTSQQDPDLAPPDMKVGCIHWALTLQVADQDGQLAIGSTVDGSVSYAKC